MPGKTQAKELLDPIPYLTEGGPAQLRHFTCRPIIGCASLYMLTTVTYPIFFPK